MPSRRDGKPRPMAFSPATTKAFRMQERSLKHRFCSGESVEPATQASKRDCQAGLGSRTSPDAGVAENHLASESQTLPPRTCQERASALNPACRQAGLVLWFKPKNAPQGPCTNWLIQPLAKCPHAGPCKVWLIRPTIKKRPVNHRSGRPDAKIPGQILLKKTVPGVRIRGCRFGCGKRPTAPGGEQWPFWWISRFWLILWNSHHRASCHAGLWQVHCSWPDLFLGQ